jgi:hypothetical protein
MKPRKKDFKKILELDHKILRFSGKLVDERGTDVGRTFVLCYYLSDDTICVFETKKRNR